METEKQAQQAIAHYRVDAPGDWGIMTAPANGSIGTERLTTQGRPDIFYRFWHVGAPATLLIMHGLGAHSGWFIDMGNSLAASGVNVYVMDHQGFGRSGGVRGHAKNWRDYLTDINAMVDVIQRDLPGTRAFVLGHSMGGVFAIQYAAAHQDRLSGMIILNPWIDDKTKVALPTVLNILAGGVVGSSKVVHLPDSGATQGMTTNPEADRLLRADPYWVRERTKGFYWQITRMRNKTLALAGKITCPTLFLQADNDLAVVPTATRKAFDRIPSTDKTYRTYPGYDHDSEFQPDRSAMDADIAGWIKQHGGN